MLVYEAHYSHILRIEASNPASEFRCNVLTRIGQQICGILKRIVTTHPQRHRLELTGQHYALVGTYFMEQRLHHNTSR